MKATDKLDPAMVAADTLLNFMVKTQFLGKEEVEVLAEWIKRQEPTCDTNAEKFFLLAAREYLLDYEAETANGK